MPIVDNIWMCKYVLYSNVSNHVHNTIEKCNSSYFYKLRKEPDHYIFLSLGAQMPIVSLCPTLCTGMLSENVCYHCNHFMILYNYVFRKNYYCYTLFWPNITIWHDADSLLANVHTYLEHWLALYFVKST